MAPDIAIVILGDPRQSHRPAEAIRIALGLSTGPNPLKIILLNESRRLLTDEAPDLIDGEILEKHLPVIQESGIPIIAPEGSSQTYSFEQGFSIQEVPSPEIARLIARADRALVFP